MQFIVRKRRNAPTVIIISLIDVLIVVLIFLMVTTTFKQQPSIKLALPESRQQKSGATENALIVYIPKQGPLYLGKDPVTLDSLQRQLIEAARKNPETSVAIKTDADAPVRQMINVMDAAKAAKITHPISVFTKPAGK